MENKETRFIVKGSEHGSIKISEDVVTIIAGLAVTEVAGVAGMSGGIAEGLAEKLGRKSFSKGVKAEVGEKEATIDLNVIIDYGQKIHDIARQIQNNVKHAVESMTGLNILQVNINVQGVSFGQESKEDDGRVK